MVIGFWNINGKDLSDSLIDLVNEQQIDILILAETKEETILRFLSKSALMHRKGPFGQISVGEKLVILSRFGSSVFEDKNNLFRASRWTMHQVQIPDIIRFNLVSVHFHSKINWSRESLALECVNLARDISIVENHTGCHETILIGDFNMNPFEDGLVASNGLNAIQDLNYVAKRPEGRNIDGTDYRYFYNPMWNFFGDFRKPFGTHYCRPSGHVSQEWNIYDQVMFRGTVKKYLDKDYVSIIDKIGGDELTKSFGRPDKKNYSDHLPIILKLKI